MKYLIKRWKRWRWRRLMDQCHEMKRHPEKYDINKMLGLKKTSEKELQKLRQIITEYETKVGQP